MGEIKEIIPCIADSEKLRVTGRVNVSFSTEIMPYVAHLIPNSGYNKKLGWISYKKGVKIITIHSDGYVAMTHVKDKPEALQILKEIEEVVEEAHLKRDQIDLSKPRERVSISPMEIYSYLPKTNCKECGEQTCMAFTVKLLNGEIDIKACKPLFREEKYAGIREALQGLLTYAGLDLDF